MCHNRCRHNAPTAQIQVRKQRKQREQREQERWLRGGPSRHRDRACESKAVEEDDAAPSRSTGAISSEPAELGSNDVRFLLDR